MMLAALLDICDGGEGTHLFQSAILFDALENKGEIPVCILNALINSNRKTFFLSSQRRKRKSGADSAILRGTNIHCQRLILSTVNLKG